MVLELYGLSRVESTVSVALSSESLGLLKGSWDLVTRVIIRVAILITPIKILITLLTKSLDPPSMTAHEPPNERRPQPTASATFDATEQ